MSRFPPCDTCGGTKFAEEDGIVTCTRCGLRQEGGLQVGDEEPDFGTQGKVVRKKVEKEKIKITRTYRGAQAYRLYLQAWQHILWRQVYVLNHGSTNAPAQLWTVARDLWTVQLSKLVHQLSEDNLATHESDSEVHDISTDEAAESQVDTVRLGLHPKLWDTVALIYASALLIRWPITLRKIYELVRAEELPFIRAIRYVPAEMSSRLPPQYKHALDTLAIPAPRDLYLAVWRMLRQLSNNFGMQFPELNWRLVLFDWIQQLGLPIEVYTTVKDLANVLEYKFQYEFPVDSTSSLVGEARTKSRKSPVAMAEVKLMCLMIIATKLLFPFSDASSQVKVKGHSSLHLDWLAWHRIHKAYRESLQHDSMTTASPAKHIEIQDREILEMSPEGLDSYMDWYQKSFTTPEASLKIQKTTLEKSILDMFPLNDLPVPDISEVPSQDVQIDELTEQIQKAALKPVLQTGVKGKQRVLEPEDEVCEEDDNFKPGSLYPIFPTIESLSFTCTEDKDDPNSSNESVAALYLHEQAAELVCLDLNRLLKAVRHVERKLEKWIAQKKRYEVFAGE